MKSRLLCIAIATSMIVLSACGIMQAAPTPTSYPTQIPYPTFTPIPIVIPTAANIPALMLENNFAYMNAEDYGSGGKCYENGNFGMRFCYKSGSETYFYEFWTETVLKATQNAVLDSMLTEIYDPEFAAGTDALLTKSANNGNASESAKLDGRYVTVNVNKNDQGDTYLEIDITSKF